MAMKDTFSHVAIHFAAAFPQAAGMPNGLMRYLLLLGVLCLTASLSKPSNAQVYHSPNCPGDNKCMQYAFLETVVTLQPPNADAFSVYVIGDVYGWCHLDISPEKMEGYAHDSVWSTVSSKYYGDAIRPFTADIYTALTWEEADRMRKAHLKNLQAAHRIVINSSWAWIVYGNCHP
jgi:hypothetical protein